VIKHLVYQLKNADVIKYFLLLMNKSRNRCFSARKLPSNQGSPEKLDPLITSKQLSLSFYNATTKKCKKQVMYDW
jgi:hypothetical protein